MGIFLFFEELLKFEGKKGLKSSRSAFRKNLEFLKFSPFLGGEFHELGGISIYFVYT